MDLNRSPSSIEIGSWKSEVLFISSRLDDCQPDNKTRIRLRDEEGRKEGTREGAAQEDDTIW